MYLLKILLTISMLSSISYAKHTFKTYDDMCEKSDEQECINDISEVKNLQIALNTDKNLNLNLKTDGKWGKNTKTAIIKFQKRYHLTPAVGYVGYKTKRQLDKISKGIKFAKVSKKREMDSNCFAYFKKNTNLRKSYKIFKDSKLLSRANSKNTKLKVDISDQRVLLYIDNKVALCSPCTTGSKRKLEPNTKSIRDKRTPKGTFSIKEKIEKKYSSIFGKYYRNGRVVYKGDKRKYRGKKAKYVGAALPNWMRLTNSGIGLHASKYIKRDPGTNGCIRLPYKVAKIIFKRVKTGTKVSIVN